MVESEQGAPSSAPAELVPWQAVEGSRGGVGARLEYALFRGAVGLLARAPAPVRAGVKGLLARLGRRVDRRHAAGARGFIRQAFEHTGRPLDARGLERQVLEAYRHLIECTLTQARFRRRFGASRARLAERTENRLAPAAHAALQAGRCVVVSAHCGDWEMASQILAALDYRPLHVISKAPSNRPMAVDLQAQREAFGVRLLPRRGAMASAGKVIEGGGRLAMLLDQRARKNPLIVPFFGRPARCDRSAAILLKRLRCPIVFVAAYRTGDLRWRLEGELVLDPEALRGASNHAITARVNAELERLIMREPDQQFWLHDRYRDTPEVAPDAPGD